ncbi:MAG: DNA/RNA non-specific endonuclease [Bacteroidota bacterium]
MRNFLVFIFLFHYLNSCAQQEATTDNGKRITIYENGTWVYTDSLPINKIKPVAINKLEIPQTQVKDILINHTAYSLSYNETHEQANWIAYELTSEETKKEFERTDKFLVDPLVKSKTANDKDYAGSGYDRGHLAPASDMGWSTTSMAESFYYSNMSPQEPGFNRGVWKKLEGLVRTWAVENNSIYIVTGPVLTPGLPTIGVNKVSVPKYYYKVILDYSQPSIKAIGFILPNSASNEPLKNYAVTVDSVENLTGINFFPLLPDDQEKILEESICISCWSWTTTISVSEDENKNKNITSTQCKGVTKSGERCQNKTLNPSGYCYLHESQQGNNTQTTTTNKTTTNNVEQKEGNRLTKSVQCSATTKAGTRCKHMTFSPNGKCFQHGGN